MSRVWLWHVDSLSVKFKPTCSRKKQHLKWNETPAMALFTWLQLESCRNTQTCKSCTSHSAHHHANEGISKLVIFHRHCRLWVAFNRVCSSSHSIAVNTSMPLNENVLKKTLCMFSVIVQELLMLILRCHYLFALQPNIWFNFQIWKIIYDSYCISAWVWSNNNDNTCM